MCNVIPDDRIPVEELKTSLRLNLMPCCMKQQGPSGTKEPRLDMCRSIISLSKIKHKMLKCGVITHSVKETWQQKEQWQWMLEARWGGGWTKFEKKGVGNKGGGGSLHKIGGLGTLCQLCYVAFQKNTATTKRL